MAALALAGCGTGTTPEAVPSTSEAPPFPEGTTMAQIATSGTVRIGVKTDIPDIGYLPPGSPGGAEPTGFDIEIAKIIAEDLQVAPEGIQWVPVGTADREYVLTSAKVDLVIATYSMTEERAAVVGQAGPYYITGQQLMVQDDSDITGLDDVEGRTLCSVAGSESDEVLVEHGAITKAYTSYAACVEALVDGELDIVSTDGAILAGFVEQHPDDVQIVGSPFGNQRYGIGFRHGDVQMCHFLRESLLKAYEDGSWKAAFESTLGKGVVEAPRAPRPDSCTPQTSGSPSSPAAD